LVDKDKLIQHILLFQVPATSEEWKKISVGFKDRWIFPNCYGSIDGKHILIQAPPNCGSNFFNYKGQNSIVLMALVDHNYCFIYIDVGCNGIVSDGGVFRNCSLYEALEEGLIPCGGCIVGDGAFPLKTYLMKPYKHLPLTVEEKVFNYRLSRARRVVENAFGILVSRFRVLEKHIACKLTTTDKIVKTACALHNWLRKTAATSYLPHGSVDEENIDTGEIIPGRWRTEINELRNLQQCDGRRATKLAEEFRNSLKRYFNNEGSVPWQYNKIF
jgi:hypothetical protein